MVGRREGRRASARLSFRPLAPESEMSTLVCARSPLRRLVNTSRLRVTGPLALESVWLTMVGARSPLQRLVNTSRLRVTATARA